MKMPKPGWKATVLKEELYEEIERLIKPNKDLPRSVSEFVNAAVAEKLQKLNIKERQSQDG
ncbi:MAG: hypothetical protein QXT73_03190 [Candidatus Methanomethylicaceae archaeon]